MKIELCHDPLHYIPNYCWIRLKNLNQHLSTLKSLFPSVKVLVINAPTNNRYTRDDMSYSLLCLEGIMDAFVDLECLSISDDLISMDSERSFPKLKHLCFDDTFTNEVPSLPSLESLRLNDCKTIKPWLEKNVGRPSKRFAISIFSIDDPVESFSCLSSLPSSLEYLKTSDFKAYKRRFQPMFPRLKEVDRLQEHISVAEEDEFGNTQFFNFLKDHKLTLMKVSSQLVYVSDEELEEMLSCLPFGTEVTFLLHQSSKRKEYIRQFRIMRRHCSEKNLHLNLIWEFSGTLIKLLQFFAILPPETQSLKLMGVESICRNEASCRTVIDRILASLLRLITLELGTYNRRDEGIRRSWSSATQGLQDSHEAILEFLEGKPQKVIIRRKN